MRIQSSVSLGRVLRESRQRLGISQQDLALAFNIPASTLNKAEHGKHGFDTDWLPLMPPIMSSDVKRTLIAEIEATC